jgi:thiamine-monophosphate kinase
MKLSRLGEDRTVAALVRRLPAGPDVRVGIGDDCAVIGEPKDEQWQLLKTDCVVEGVHFLRSAKPADVGWKALCRAISDIAAMGGTPEHALITIALPRELDFSWVRELYNGVRRAARAFDVGIVGGETSRSPGPIFINVALTGWVERRCCVRRDRGRPGDVLFVTGHLGGSLTRKHLTFQPRVSEARWLTNHFRIRAMMDLSDGLAADLPRLAEASKCGYELWPGQIPRTRGCTVEQALGDGEDYELLLAIPPKLAPDLEKRWKMRFPRLALTRVGVLTRQSSRNTPHSARGYDHFAQP